MTKDDVVSELREIAIKAAKSEVIDPDTRRHIFQGLIDFINGVENGI